MKLDKIMMNIFEKLFYILAGMFVAGMLEHGIQFKLAAALVCCLAAAIACRVRTRKLESGNYEYDETE